MVYFDLIMLHSAVNDYIAFHTFLLAPDTDSLVYVHHGSRTLRLVALKIVLKTLHYAVANSSMGNCLRAFSLVHLQTKESNV